MGMVEEQYIHHHGSRQQHHGHHHGRGGTGDQDRVRHPAHRRARRVRCPRHDNGLGEAQWLELGEKWKFEEIPVSNAAAAYLTADLLQAPKPLPMSTAAV